MVGTVPMTVTVAKADAELSLALTLVDELDWSGCVLTVDALYCPRTLC